MMCCTLPSPPGSVTCSGHCLSTAAEVFGVRRDTVFGLHAVWVGDAGTIPLQGGHLLKCGCVLFSD